MGKNKSWKDEKKEALNTKCERLVLLGLKKQTNTD